MLSRLLAVVLLGTLSRGDVVVIPGAPSAWIVESGNDSGGTSHYECSNNEIMIGRQHSGDENGQTQYECGSLYDQATLAQLAPYTGYASWSSWIEESGKSTGGTSRFECPTGQAMIGREHSGDENGETRYECAPFGFSNGTFYSTNLQDWSQWIQESGKDSGGTSSFTCPSNEVMTGRAHSGDENGDTQYRCAFAVPAPLVAETSEEPLTSVEPTPA